MAPGWIKTPSSLSQELEYGERTPMRRMGEPAEIAAAVAFFCSPSGVLCHRPDAGRRRWQLDPRGQPGLNGRIGHECVTVVPSAQARVARVTRTVTSDPTGDLCHHLSTVRLRRWSLALVAVATHCVARAGPGHRRWAPGTTPTITAPADGADGHVVSRCWSPQTAPPPSCGSSWMAQVEYEQLVAVVGGCGQRRSSRARAER